MNKIQTTSYPRNHLPSLVFSMACSLMTAQLALGNGLITLGPYLQNVTPNSIVIMWQTDFPMESHIAYWLPAQDKSYVTAPQACVRHELVLSDLQPSKDYRYAVLVQGQEVFTSAFRTAPDGPQSFRWVVYGDSRSYPVDHAAVVQAIVNNQPRIVLHTGDLVGIGDDHASWTPEFFEPAHSLLHHTPVFPIMGNHEYFYSGRSWFSSFFSLPNNEQWFAFTYGNVRFIGLDTNVSFHPGGVQHRWFQAELASDAFRQADWHIVYFHHPAFTASVYRDDLEVRQYLVPLFETGGVDLVFSGHSHAYERYAHNDVHYIVTGGGGTYLVPLAHDLEAPFRLVGESVYHHCVVDVNVPDHSLTFSAQLNDGTRFDELFLNKPVPDPKLPDAGVGG